MLIAKGSKVNALFTYDKTPLDYARSRRKKDINLTFKSRPALPDVIVIKAAREEVPQFLTRAHLQ